MWGRRNGAMMATRPELLTLTITSPSFDWNSRAFFFLFYIDLEISLLSFNFFFFVFSCCTLSFFYKRKKDYLIVPRLNMLQNCGVWDFFICSTLLMNTWCAGDFFFFVKAHVPFCFMIYFFAWLINSAMYISFFLSKNL